MIDFEGYMISEKLSFPETGNNTLFNYAGEMVRFPVENQLLDKETWKLLVHQFRIHSDVDNDWRGEFWGKMMRGAALTYRATKNAELYAVMQETIEDLLTTQERNGRISSYPIEKEFNGWDMWSRKYIMLGLIYFLEICRSKKFHQKVLRALMRHADYIIEHVGEGEGKKNIFATSQNYGGLNSCSILEPFVKLFALTNERRYFEFSTYIVKLGFCKDMNLIEACLDGKKYPYQFKHTKAYEMMSCFEGLLEYYKHTGNEAHLQAVINFVDMVVKTDYTIIGCSGCTHELFDNSIKGQTEPAPDEVMQETCVTVTFIKLCAKLLSLTKNAKYAHLIERSSLNALFGAVNNEKQTMHRADALVWTLDSVKSEKHEPFPFDSYSPLFQDRRGRRVAGYKPLQNGRSYGCCACIASAGTAIVGLFAVMTSEDGVYVNLYNDGKFCVPTASGELRLAVYANLYKRNTVKIRVCGNGEKTIIALRMPDWSNVFNVTLNGEAANGNVEDGYYKIMGAWTNEQIEIKLDTQVKAVTRNGKIAFVKGPFVLARDERFEDITKPIHVTARNGKHVRVRAVKNDLFASNITYKKQTVNGDITLCDYAQAGKNYDDEHCNITVWQERI